MIPVSSSQIAEVGYNSDLRKLRIRFATLSLYEYDGVDLPVFEGLVNAPSVGSYFHSTIKNIYPYERIE
jgi:hypothetical protein